MVKDLFERFAVTFEKVNSYIVFVIAPEGSFFFPAAKSRGDFIAKFVFFFSVFSDFSCFPKSSENESCFCSWWLSGEIERVI